MSATSSLHAAAAGRGASPGVDLDDIQGLLRRGYSQHPEATYLLLQVKQRDEARAWLARVEVADANRRESSTLLQLALSAPGLRALGVPADIVDAFAPEFVDGMAGNPNRERRLGDLGDSAPAAWRWGSGERVPHVLLLLYAQAGRLADWQREVEAGFGDAFTILDRLQTRDRAGAEPFGFADGVSQPWLDWQRQRPARDAEQRAYTNLACLGEFVLGYPNEYGGYTDRPLLDPRREGAGALPRAEDDATRADLGRNGSYLVLRQLHQDVAGFWRWMQREARGDADAARRLAETLVGRRMDGRPLVDRAARPIAGNEGERAALNAFTFDGDPQGLRCPLGAHVRRANPRNADLPPGAPGLVSWFARTLGFDAQAAERDRVASTRFHRLLRRGRAYGEAPAQAPAADAGGDEQGLHFICLNANIARQFEFVQSAWIVGTHFDGLPDEGDPLLGHRQPGCDGRPTDGFSIPRADAPDCRLHGLPRFVGVRGGAYFFMPGLRALRCLASVR